MRACMSSQSLTVSFVLMAGFSIAVPEVPHLLDVDFDLARFASLASRSDCTA